MERVDFVTTGPPCPPFSSIGPRKSEKDHREPVFRKVTDCIVHQGSLGCYGFMLEMVTGIAESSHRPWGSQTYCFNYYEEWLCDLQRRAPMFHLHTWALQTSDYLPQSRMRLYTIGIHRDFAPPCGLPSPSPPRSTWRVALQDLLHKGLCPINEGVLSPQQRQNLMVVKQSLALQPIGHGGCIHCISVDRDPRQTRAVVETFGAQSELAL